MVIFQLRPFVLLYRHYLSRNNCQTNSTWQWYKATHVYANCSLNNQFRL